MMARGQNMLRGFDVIWQSGTTSQIALTKTLSEVKKYKID
jgi:hypothetical protein